MIAGQQRTSSAGRNNPTATSVPRAPIADTSAGATRAPTAIVPSSRLSRTPKTRPSTASSRCPLHQRHPRDVDERVADPDQREQDDREREVRPDGGERDRDAPEHDANPEVGRQPFAAREAGHRDDAEEAADAHAGVEPADRTVAAVEETQGEHDDQDFERTCDEGLRRRQPDDDPQRRVRADRVEPREQLGAADGARSSPAGGESCGMRNEERCGPRKLAALTAKTAPGLLTASSAPPTAGPTNMPMLETLFMTAFAAVSSSGDATSDGSNAPWAGAKTDETIVAQTASTKTARYDACSKARTDIAPRSTSGSGRLRA